MGEFDTKRNGIPVKILETGEEFNSIRACADAIGGNATCISRVVNGNKGYCTCHGFHILRIGRDSETRTDKRGRPGIEVQIVETGKTYASIEKCAKDINGSPTAIKDILRQQNNRVSHKGYHFKRIT